MESMTTSAVQSLEQVWAKHGSMVGEIVGKTVGDWVGSNVGAEDVGELVIKLSRNKNLFVVDLQAKFLHTSNLYQQVRRIFQFMSVLRHFIKTAIKKKIVKLI